jgi:hypothetical protein
MMSRQTTESRLIDQWNALHALVMAHVYGGLSNAEAMRSVDLERRYHVLLDSVKHNWHHGESCMLGLYRAPGSKDRHHAYEGGLVAHLLEMWECWRLLREQIMKNVPPPNGINDSLVLRAIIHHDLNKVHRYRLVSVEGVQVIDGGDDQVRVPWAVEYANANEDPLGHVLTSTQKSIHFIMRADIELDPLMHNALITAEGGFMRDRPGTESVFAKLMYILDELSANVFSRLNAEQFWDSKQGGLREVP